MPILGSNNVYRAYAENCAHVLCSECLGENAPESGDNGNVAPRCPLCFPVGATIATAEVECRYSSGDGEHGDYFRPQGHSSKMAALISDVREDLWGTKRQVLVNRLRNLTT
jgi:hypothetical protein